MYAIVSVPIFTPHLLEMILAAALNGVLIFVGAAGVLDL